jgi:hypothetical protein
MQSAGWSMKTLRSIPKAPDGIAIAPRPHTTFSAPAVVLLKNDVAGRRELSDVFGMGHYSARPGDRQPAVGTRERHVT